MSLYSSEASFLPNLPGFKPKHRNTGFKKTYFTVVDGLVIEKDPPFPVIGNGDVPEDQSVNSIGNTTANINRRKISVATGITLTFQAYFEDNPINTPAGAPQIRKCNIYYFIDDGTLRVVEKPQLNSGVSQGTLVRRAVVSKPDGTPINEYDLILGEEITIYGRSYRLFDCDASTRQYLEEHLNQSLPGSISPPSDTYQEYRMTLQPAIEDTVVKKFHSKKNDNKTWAEADNGHFVDNSGREGFIRFGNRSLKFRCVWDNTHNLYGDVNEYTLQYFLSDDTVEICLIPNPNIKEQGPAKLLKRSKLPKNFATSLIMGNRPNPSNFLHWSDICIGMRLSVYGRDLQLMDADQKTREFYHTFDFPLGNPIYLPKPIVTIQKREIPPPTGYGTEEDSMRSVSGSLLPGPMPTKKLGENRILSFLCSLESGGVDDVDRRFVLSYYLVDYTFKILEPPIRNSGFVGGVFLSRREIKKPNGEMLNERDLIVGTKIPILKHVFRLLESADATFRWMEDKGLPQSDFYLILEKIRPRLSADAANGKLAAAFKSFETAEGGVGNTTREALTTILNNYGCLRDADGYELMVEHELITLSRINQGRSKYFSYETLIREILVPSGEFKLYS